MVFPQRNLRKKRLLIEVKEIFYQRQFAFCLESFATLKTDTSGHQPTIDFDRNGFSCWVLTSKPHGKHFG